MGLLEAPVSDDPILEARRAEIAALDLRILEAVNARIEAVRALKAHKEARGLPFHDPDQERRLLDRLCAGNPGPLPEAGLRELFGLVLSLTKRAVEQPGG